MTKMFLKKSQESLFSIIPTLKSIKKSKNVNLKKRKFEKFDPLYTVPLVEIKVAFLEKICHLDQSPVKKNRSSIEIFFIEGGGTYSFQII